MWRTNHEFMDTNQLCIVWDGSQAHQYRTSVGIFRERFTSFEGKVEMEGIACRVVGINRSTEFMPSNSSGVTL